MAKIVFELLEKMSANPGKVFFRSINMKISKLFERSQLGLFLKIFLLNKLLKHVYLKNEY